MARREGLAGGGSLADERNLARSLRRPADSLGNSPSSDAAPTASATSDAERKARVQLVQMERVASKYGAESRITPERIEAQRDKIRAFADAPTMPTQAPRSPAYTCAPITWLDRPVMIGPTGKVPVCGYDSRIGCPAWLRAELAAREEAA